MILRANHLGFESRLYCLWGGSLWESYSVSLTLCVLIYEMRIQGCSLHRVDVKSEKNNVTEASSPVHVIRSEGVVNVSSGHYLPYRKPLWWIKLVSLPLACTPVTPSLTHSQVTPCTALAYFLVDFPF